MTGMSHTSLGTTSHPRRWTTSATETLWSSRARKVEEFRTVEARFAKNLSAGINIRLDPATLAELRREARQKGIGPTTLARMWILEHLHRPHNQR